MKHLMTCALIVSASLLLAQENAKSKENNPVRVRIKKVEKINGTEKLTDTTYMMDGPVFIEDFGDVPKSDTKGTESEKIVIITDEVHGNDVKIVDKNEVMDEQLQRALEIVARDGKTVENLMLVDTDAGKTEGKKTSKIVIIKTAKITGPTAEESRMLNKENGNADGKLVIEKMNFYPNPNSGKFNLTFTLPEKGDTEITILNIDGKIVYRESLPNFSSTYDKEIDISKNAKGVYFVKVEQGKHAQVKKIVLE